MRRRFVDSPLSTQGVLYTANEWEEDGAEYGTFDLRAALNFYCYEAGSIMVGIKIKLDLMRMRCNRAWRTRSIRLWHNGQFDRVLQTLITLSLAEVNLEIVCQKHFDEGGWSPSKIHETKGSAPIRNTTQLKMRRLGSRYLWICTRDSYKMERICVTYHWNKSSLATTGHWCPSQRDWGCGRNPKKLKCYHPPLLHQDCQISSQSSTVFAGCWQSQAKIDFHIPDLRGTTCAYSTRSRRRARLVHTTTCVGKQGRSVVVSYECGMLVLLCSM